MGRIERIDSSIHHYSLPSTKCNTIDAAGITIFSFHHRNFPKPSAGHITRGV
jgi:hypothetical protein